LGTKEKWKKSCPPKFKKKKGKAPWGHGWAFPLAMRISE
jgi:hypothetical protein